MDSIENDDDLWEDVDSDEGSLMDFDMNDDFGIGFDYDRGCLFCGKVDTRKKFTISSAETMRKVIDIASGPKHIHIKARILGVQLEAYRAPKFCCHPECYKSFMKPQTVSNQDLTRQSNEEEFQKICDHLELHTEQMFDLETSWFASGDKKKWNLSYVRKKLREKYGSSVHFQGNKLFLECKARDLIKKLEDQLDNDQTDNTKNLIMQLAAKVVLRVR